MPRHGVPTRRGIAQIVAGAAIACIAACSSPSPTLYTIDVVQGAPKSGGGQSGGPAIVSVREIGVARYLERPQIVRSASDNRLDVRANDWWGEPLGAMLTRVMVAELGQRLPNSNIFGDNGAITITPDATVEINIERMDEAGPQMVALVALASVSFAHANGGRPILSTIRLQTPAPSGDIAGDVAAMSAAIGQLADRVAAMLRAGPAGA